MRDVSRRQMLRGAGVALALPWLESLAPRAARAQAATARKRYVSMFFPNGAGPYWWPAAPGVGDGWQLSSLLEPLAPLKSQVAVLGNVANTAPWGGHIEPSHGNLCASTFTGVRANGPGNAWSGTSVDQAIAKTIGGATALSSLQLGLSTLDSYTDGNPGQHSRSISWSDPQTPLYKTISPQAVFDRLVGGTPGTAAADPLAGPGKAAVDPLAERRRLLKLSTLDYLKDSTSALQTRLGQGDRARLDKFLTSVRALEKRVAAPPMQVNAPGACAMLPRPTEVYSVGQSAYAAIGGESAPGDKPAAGYDRGVHADLMIDLAVMALQCDMTRVISFMLDDERSDFVYNFLSAREFTPTTSVPSPTPVVIGGYHGLQHCNDIDNRYLTVIHWNVQKLARLASKLAATVEGDGGSILDNTVIMLATGMHGGNHDNSDLPIVVVGGGGGVLKRNVYQRWTTPVQLADVHLTIIQKVFGAADTSFGVSTGIVPELLA
jgi:hypothetical protein